jgi:hypothetical protein
MLVAILALVIALSKKDKLSLKGPKKQSVKPLSDPDTEGCYAAYKALAELYASSDSTSDGALITAFGTACPTTAGKSPCSDLITTLTDNANPAGATDKAKFAADCKVEAPSDGGDSSGDNGLISAKANKIMMLFGLASTLLYFLH